jgi:hypothetical protein
MQHPQRSRRLRVHVFASSYRRIASFGSALLPAAKSSRRAIGKDGFFPASRGQEASKRELDRYSGKNGDEVLRSFLCCRTYQIVLGNQLIFIPHDSPAVAAN